MKTKEKTWATKFKELLFKKDKEVCLETLKAEVEIEESTKRAIKEFLSFYELDNCGSRNELNKKVKKCLKESTDAPDRLEFIMLHRYVTHLALISIMFNVLSIFAAFVGFIITYGIVHGLTMNFNMWCFYLWCMHQIFTFLILHWLRIRNTKILLKKHNVSAKLMIKEINFSFRKLTVFGIIKRIISILSVELKEKTTPVYLIVLVVIVVIALI